MPDPAAHRLAAELFGKFAFAPAHTLSSGEVMRLFPLHSADDLAWSLALLIHRKHVVAEKHRFRLTPEGRKALQEISERN